MIKGYVARSDSKKQIIVAIRGTFSLENVLADIIAFQTPEGQIPNCPTCRVHDGFYLAWRAVETTIETTIANQIHDYPEYQLLITGHSLGGAVAALLVHFNSKTI